MQGTESVLPAGSNDPKDLAKLFKYYRQFANKILKCRQKFRNIQATVEYARGKKALDRLNAVLGKYGIDKEGFVRYCALGTSCASAREMADVKYIKAYADHLKRVEQYGNIVHNFRRSAENLADMCIEHETTPAEEIARIVMENKLAYEYLSGRLSKYFIASIRNFRKIYEKLDRMNKDELRILFDVSDELHEDVKRAFLRYERRTVAPLQLTDEIKRNKLNQNQTQEEE